MTDETKPNYLKPYEPWIIAYFHDPIAIPLARMLAALRVHPNMITALGLVVGLASGIFYAMGLWLCGVILYSLAFLLDTIDGKVARLRQMTSEYGRRLDALADYVRKPSCLLGMFVYFILHNMFLFAGLTVVAGFVYWGIHRLYKLAGVSEFDLEFPVFHLKVVRRFCPRVIALYTNFEEQFFQFTVFPLIAVLVGLPDGAVWFFWGALIVALLNLAKIARIRHFRKKGQYDICHQRWLYITGDIDKG